MLGISIEDYDIFMKYVGGLAEYIRKELKLSKVSTIDEATVKAIAIEAKNKKSDSRDDRLKIGGKPNSKFSKKGEPSRRKDNSPRKNYCDHCRIRTCEG